MDLIRIFDQFPDHEACIEHLERVRWARQPVCPRCGSERVGHRADGIGRRNCHACRASFTVLSGTIFSKTRTDLRKWFLAIALVLNEKESISSPQLSRDLDVPQKTAYRMLVKIRSAMVGESDLMVRIVEADEAYVGGESRGRNRHGDDEPKSPVAAARASSL